MIRIPNKGLFKDDSPEAIAYKQELEAQIEASKTPIKKRLEEYGSVAKQIEYIVENGLEAFVARQNAIKAKYPKE